MSSIYSLNGFTYFDFGSGPTSISPITVDLQGSDDLGFTFSPDVGSTDPADITGMIDITSGEFYGALIGGSPVDLTDDNYDIGMGEVSVDGNTSQILTITDTTSQQVMVFLASGDPIGSGSAPTEAELTNYLENGTVSDIPSGPFAPGTEFSPGDLADTNVNSDPFAGTSGDDSIVGFPSDDLLEGLEGNDTLNGDYGNDTLLGGDGDDIVTGGAGNDDMNGGAGADTVNLSGFGNGGLDIVRGSAADFAGDTINGLDFGDQILLEGVSESSVTILGSSIEIETTGDDTPEAIFNYTTVGSADLVSMEMPGGGGTMLQLDPAAAPEPGIGQTIEGPQDFGQIGDFLFADDSIVPSDIYYVGAVESLALLPDGHAINEISGEAPEQVVGIDRGVFLSSGGGPGTENTSGSFTVNLGEPGDPRLTETARDAFPNAGSTNDASLLTFTFDADVLGDQPSISFDLFFGSDEFPEYVDSSFVDIAAVYVNGVNYALFNNDPNQPLSITGDSINTPGNFYSNNGDDGSDDDPFTGTFDTEYDGFSVLLNVLAPVQPGVNTVTIAVADTGDSAWDSGIFVGNIEGSDVEAGGSFVETNGTDGADQITANAAPQIINLGGGEDTVSGTPDELNGDVINDFMDDDMLTFEGSSFTIDDVTVTLGSAILDIDTDGDAEADTNVTLQGNFSQATFNVAQDGDNTNVTAEGVLPESEEIDGTADDDTLVGTAGDDVINGLGGNDRLEGLAGNDELNGGDGNDGLLGGVGNDTLNGGEGDDNLAASDGNDVVNGGGGRDLMGGGLGDDMMDGESGNDFMGGGQGNDTVMGSDGNDVVNGGAGDDELSGGTGSDTMGGSFNSDLVEGGEGDDDMGGGAGQDTVNAGAGDDSVGGGEGDDVINGGDGADFLAGGGRDDTIDGGAGDDTINGGDGDDVMTGGDGADQFVYNFFKDGDADVITDYEDGVDNFLIQTVNPNDGTVNIDNGGNGLAGYLAALNITDTADGAQFNVDGHTVLVEGVAASDLTLEDFTFI
ncbi:calcium-binding protein [Rhodosalinus halophilus]|uniref:Calcium-binding protein n=1 Tax=Rhodosalinus halophilus TaxID=2259333 RepID=A0A365U834_9RHOB|nr:choice-of-anchor L domain-containing protein [Rhodosalinus halophilus]RBI84584.1 calcium-binding protein [Rhodosalinus halophilus]